MRPVYLSTSDASAGNKDSAVCPMDRGVSPTNISLVAVVTGVATYSVQFTLDDVYSPTFDPASATWIDVDTQSGIVNANSQGTIISPVSAVRLHQTAGAGSVALTVQQAGIA